MEEEARGNKGEGGDGVCYEMRVVVVLRFLYKQSRIWLLAAAVAGRSAISTGYSVSFI